MTREKWTSRWSIRQVRQNPIGPSETGWPDYLNSGECAASDSAPDLRAKAVEDQDGHALPVKSV